MRRRLLLFAIVLLLLPVPGWAKDDGKALMLTVFGTSSEAAVTFDELLPLVEKQFPGRTVVVPYTSGVIRDKLNAAISAPEKTILSPAQMLEKLKADGYTDIAVVSTILFPGVEHDKLRASVEAFAAANKSIAVSYTPPLLSEPSNHQPVVDTLGKYMIANGGNVIVAHGTHNGHPVEELYLKIAERVARTYPNARAGSLEGAPGMADAMNWLKERNGAEARFIVLMFVAGDHAENDVASDEDDSLFSTAGKMGKTPSVAYVDTKSGKRIASLGLDPEYRKLLLEYYAKNVQ